jgi:hypothetical protein
MFQRTVVLAAAIVAGLLTLGCERGGRGSGAMGMMFPGPGGGGSSGVSGTSAEARQLCTYVIAQQGGTREVMCDETTTYIIPSVDECASELEAFPDCPALIVSDVEGCARATGPDPCMRPAGSESACSELIMCAFMGMGTEG